MNNVHERLVEGIECQKAGALDKAEAIYREMLTDETVKPRATLLLGVLLLQRGQLKAACDSLAAVVTLLPQDAGAWYHLALAQHRSGQYGVAKDSYEQALACKPDHHIAKANLAALLVHVRDFEEAAVRFSELCREGAATAETLVNFSLCQRHLGDYSASLQHAKEALALKEDYLLAHFEVACAYEGLQSLDKTKETLLSLTEQYPKAAEVYHQLALFYFRHRDYDNAGEAVSHAVVLAPDNATYHNTFGEIKRQQGAYDKARQAFEKAIAIEPNGPMAHFNLGLVLQTQEIFPEAWMQLVWRFATGQNLEVNVPSGGCPRLETLPCQHLLVVAEQGLGDELVCLTLLPELIAQCEEMTWQADSRLLPLLQQTYPNVAFVDRREPIENRFTAMVPAWSLCTLLRLSVEDFVWQGPLLKPNSATVTEYQSAFAKGKKHIGVAWRTFHPHYGRELSMTLNDLKHVFEDPDIVCHALQYGEVGHDMSTADFDIIQPDFDIKEDLTSLAAYMAALDGIITIDSSIVAMAGALEKPTALVLPEVARPMWGTGDGPTRWFPSVSVIRKTADWQKTVAACL